MRPMMKLLSQLEAVERPTPLARREEGKISAGMAQGTGPQEAPKAVTIVLAWRERDGKGRIHTNHIQKQECHTRPSRPSMRRPIT